MPLNFIAFFGKKTSGKDTAANIFKKYIRPPDRVVRVGFADALKEEICVALKITLPYLEEHKSHFRLILQGYGNDYKRQLIHRDYWVNKWLEKVHDLQTFKTITYVLVTDLRYQNEYDILKELSAIFIKITRPSLDNINDQHISETEQSNFKCDYEFINDKTIIDLENTIKQNINKIL